MQINLKTVTLFQKCNIYDRTGASVCGVPGSTDETTDAPLVGSAVFLYVDHGWRGQSGKVNYSVIAFRFELNT